MISIQILFCYLSYHKPHEQIHVLLVLTVSFFSLLISLYISFARPVWLSGTVLHSNHRDNDQPASQDVLLCLKNRNRKLSKPKGAGAFFQNPHQVRYNLLS